MIEKQNIACPLCNTEIAVDSVREYSNWEKRMYWECSDCKISVMKR